MGTIVKTLILLVIFFAICRLVHRPFARYPALYRKCKWLILAVYLLSVLYITVFSRQQNPEPIIKLQLFWSYEESFLNKDWPLLIQIVLNVLLYLPFGFIIAGTAEKLSWWKVGILAVIFSAITELSQLIFCLGFFEFDDILHNTLGALAGYGIYKILGFNRDE